MADNILPISVVIPTRNRSIVLKKTLATIAQQSAQPFEIILIDASENTDTNKVYSDGIQGLESKLIYKKAIVKGAASQRNEGIALSDQPFIAFMDDDVYLEPNCFSLLWNAINTSSDVGAVNALITNQQFHPPGKISRTFYRLFTSKEQLKNLEGKTIGPSINFLSSEKNILSLIPVDWLNLGLTIYKREALPEPVFDPYFTGYSFMEDAALSFVVNREWKLYTVRDARIYHDSQPGDHKNNVEQLAEMEIVNRYYIMTRILHKTSFKNKIGFIIFQLFYITASGGLFDLKTWKGKLKGIKKIWVNRKR